VPREAYAGTDGLEVMTGWLTGAEFERDSPGGPTTCSGGSQSRVGRLRDGTGELFCLEYPSPGFSPKLRPPYDGPFPDVPVLMLNGDIDLQTAGPVRRPDAIYRRSGAASRAQRG